jgi:hypothetical protein
MPFLRDMLGSAQSWLARPDVSLACFDIGLDPEDRQWLTAQGARIVTPRAHFGIDAASHPAALLSCLARPFLPEYLPGFDIYLWIDSDIWLQDPAVLQSYINGVQQNGMAIAHERSGAYRFQPLLFGSISKHFMLGFGLPEAAFLLTRRPVNAGMFAIAAEAPHWAEWASCYRAAVKRTGALVPHDQLSLNQVLHGRALRPGGLPVTLLPPTCNWLCDRGVPMWNDAEATFCEPRPPFTPLRALHLAGRATHTAYTIRRTGGGSFTTCILHGASPGTPRLSPTLKT